MTTEAEAGGVLSIEAFRERLRWYGDVHERIGRREPYMGRDETIGRANECADLRDQLLDAYARALGDARRLDYLEAFSTKCVGRGGVLITATDGLWEVGETPSAGFDGFSDGEGPDLRAAIDAAQEAK